MILILIHEHVYIFKIKLDCIFRSLFSFDIRTTNLIFKSFIIGRIFFIDICGSFSDATLTFQGFTIACLRFRCNVFIFL